MMLKEQLEERRKTARSLLHTKSSRISFILDDDVDNLTLFNNLPFQTPFTNSKSLSFDRQQFSEKEEKKFNRKFTPFLRELISKMKENGIEVLLEYLLRIYNIDTFNPRELTFLILPFKKYFRQLQTLSQTARTQFLSLKSYSIPAISRIVVSDRRLFIDFVEYFRNYSILADFLDRMLDEMIEIVKTSDVDYLSEFYQIMRYLFNSENYSVALRIYHRASAYLSTPDFIEILSEHYPVEAITISSYAAPESEYEYAYKNGCGRLFLKDPIKLNKYVTYLHKTSKIPSEFNQCELNALKTLVIGEKFLISKFEDIVELFNEIEPKTELFNLILENKAEKYFLDHLSDEFKGIVLSKTFDISLFTASNYELMIGYLDKRIFQERYSEILERCLDFISFDPSLFTRFVHFDRLDARSSVFIRNLIWLADRTNTHIDYESFVRTDQSILPYILTHKICSNPQEAHSLLDSALSAKSPAIMADLCVFIENNIGMLTSAAGDKPFDLKAFIQESSLSGFGSNVAVLAIKLGHLLDYELLFALFSETGNESIFVQLMERDYEHTILRTVKTRCFDLVVKLIEMKGMAEIINCSGVEMLGFLEIHFQRLIEATNQEDRLVLVEFLLFNITDQRSLPLAIACLDDFITLRTSPVWLVAKAFLIECITERYQYQRVLDFILSNFQLFNDDDVDLFEKILQSDAHIDICRLKDICMHPHSAVFVHHLIMSRGCNDLLPVIPFVAPLLIQNKKPSLERLFDVYGNIMCAYVRDILCSYREMSHLLLKIDSQHTISYICDHFTVEDISLLSKILQTKTCKNPEIFRSVCRVFKKHISDITAECVTNLVRFFSLSVSDHPKSQSRMTDFLRCVHSNRIAIFYESSHQCLPKNPRVYSELIDEIATADLDENVISFLCAYLEHGGEAVFDGLELFDKVFATRSNAAPRLLSLIAQCVPGIVEYTSELFLGYLENSDELKFVLSVLLEILRLIPSTKREYGDSFTPYIAILSENSTDVIESKAREILELMVQ